MDDRVRRGSFTFDLPVWAVTYRKEGSKPNEVTFVCGEDELGSWLHLFTDEDLVERFIAASPPGERPGARPWKLETAESLLSVLETLLRAGVAKVAWDATRMPGGADGRIACGISLQELANVIRSGRK